MVGKETKSMENIESKGCDAKEGKTASLLSPHLKSGKQGLQNMPQNWTVGKAFTCSVTLPLNLI